MKTPNKNLIGANIGDTYMAKLAHGMVFNQGLVVTPSFNIPSAYSALATAGLTFPVYKRLGFNLSALDDFLNDPGIWQQKELLPVQRWLDIHAEVGKGWINRPETSYKW